MNASQDVKNILHPHVDYMLRASQEFLKQAQLGGKVTSGIGVSDSGIVAAFLEYSPRSDPTEEVLDAIIDIAVGSHEVHYEADVCWSSGRVLAEIVDKRISYSTNQDLLTFIEEQTNQIKDELVNSLMTFARTAKEANHD